MNSFAPLFAAGIDPGLIKLVLLLAFIVFGWIAKKMAAKQQAQPPAGRPRPQAPPRPIPADAADEIEDFLRRAAQQRAAQPPQPPRSITAVTAAQSSRLAAVGTAASQPIKAEVVAAAPVGGQVTEHVSKYLDTGEFTRHSDQLGEEVTAEVDRDIDQHLRQVFDHSVSRLASIGGETAAPPVAVGPPDIAEPSAAEAPPAIATDLVSLLADADSIRQAVVLSEIIRRPEERW